MEPVPNPSAKRNGAKIQVDFQQGSRAMSRYFQVYRTARPLTLKPHLAVCKVGTCFFDDVGLLQILMLVMFLVRNSC